MMAATLIMCFAFSLSAMAAPSPEDEYDRESPEQTNVDKKTQIDDDEFDKDEKPAKICITRCSSISCICSKTRQRTVLIKKQGGFLQS